MASMGTSKPKLVTVPLSGEGLGSTPKVKAKSPFGATSGPVVSELENCPSTVTSSVAPLAIPHTAVNSKKGKTRFDMLAS
jgi:hypothetical protein